MRNHIAQPTHLFPWELVIPFFEGFRQRPRHLTHLQEIKAHGIPLHKLIGGDKGIVILPDLLQSDANAYTVEEHMINTLEILIPNDHRPEPLYCECSVKIF